NRLPALSGRLETPAAHGFDRFVVVAKRRLESPDDVDAADRSVGQHDDAQLDEPLRPRAERVDGVLRLDVTQQARPRHIAARLHRPTATVAVLTGSQSGPIARAGSVTPTTISSWPGARSARRQLGR